MKFAPLLGDRLAQTALNRARALPVVSPVGQVDCVTVRAPWLDDGGDGWTVARRGRVVAFVVAGSGTSCPNAQRRGTRRRWRRRPYR